MVSIDSSRSTLSGLGFGLPATWLQSLSFRAIVNTLSGYRVYVSDKPLSDGSIVAALSELRPARSGLVLMNPPAGASETDDALVRAAQRGDRAAFGLLYSRYARMVHGVLLSRVPFSAAEDLVHDVFLQALPRIGSLREASRFPGWLAAIARNTANDYYRRAKPAVELKQESGDPGIERRPSDLPRSPQSNAEALAVLEAIGSLPDAYRETLVLRLVEGMTGPEIAARTGLTHGSVRVNLHRGMQHLREILSGKARPATGGDS